MTTPVTPDHTDSRALCPDLIRWILSLRRRERAAAEFRRGRASAWGLSRGSRRAPPRAAASSRASVAPTRLAPRFLVQMHLTWHG